MAAALSYPERILEYGRSLPEGSLLVATGLAHLGAVASVAHALSVLAERNELLRVSWGIYVLPVRGPLGTRAPAIEVVLEALARHTGEVLAPSGPLAAKSLGLTRKLPERLAWLTSGRSRMLDCGPQPVELRHAPAWQLLLPGRVAGDVIRVLAWLGPGRVRRAVLDLRGRLMGQTVAEVGTVLSQLPRWLGEELIALAPRSQRHAWTQLLRTVPVERLPLAGRKRPLRQPADPADY